MTPRLTYHLDPLCGWCFGIGDALAEARRRLDGRVTWELSMGGLVVGERVRPIAHDEQYLRNGLAQVATVTGRTAGSEYFDGILADGTWVSDSEPSCRAVLVVRDLADDSTAIDFAHRLTDRLYMDGRRPDDAAAIRACAESMGLDGGEVVRRWEFDDARRALQTHWAETRRSGLTTYPTIAARNGDALVPIVVGYAPADDIVDAVVQAALGI